MDAWRLITCGLNYAGVITGARVTTIRAERARTSAELYQMTNNASRGGF